MGNISIRHLNVLYFCCFFCKSICTPTRLYPHLWTRTINYN